MRLCALLAALVLVAGCDNPNPTDGDADVDVDVDADGDADPCPPEAECCSNADCSNGIFCDGIEICDRGQCDPGLPPDCSDGLDCTVDSCDEMANVCVHRPNHAVCDDGDTCNGVERCEPADDDHDALGCVRGLPRICDDGDDCTEDYCEEDECRVRIRDADGDGHADRNCAMCPTPETCVRGDDCDDNDASIFPGATEICDDGKDNDCDRARDYASPSCTVPNNTCATALELRAGVTLFSSTRGTTASIDEACGAAASRDVAMYFALSAESDVRFVFDTTGGADLFVALTTDCGVGAATLRCDSGRDFEVSARGLLPGTYYLIAASSAEVDFTVRMTVAAASASPDGDLCSEPIALPGTGATVTGSLSGMAHDYPVSCGDRDYPGRDTVYQLTVPTEQTADFRLARTSGTGPIALAVQRTCGLSTSERACWNGEPEAAGRIWRILPGTYYVVVSHADEVGFELQATLSPLDPDLFFAEDFGAGASGWTFGGGWQRGTPSATSEPTPIGGACVGTRIGGDYTMGMSYATDYAQTPDIDLRGSAAPVLRFSSWMRMENSWGYPYAGGHIEIRAGGGAWTTVTAVTPAYDGTVGGGQAWYGEHGSWGTWEANLSAWRSSVVAIRFSAYSDWWGSGGYAGWYVDDVLVIDP